jgi:hypothetical protein
MISMKGKEHLLNILDMKNELSDQNLTGNVGSPFRRSVIKELGVSKEMVEDAVNQLIRSSQNDGASWTDRIGKGDSRSAFK